METVYVYLQEAKPKKKSKNWFKTWDCSKKVEEVIVVTTVPVKKELVEVEYDLWNDETTYTFEYSV